MSTAAIIVASGTGNRFGKPKQFELLAERPIYFHSVEQFAQVESIDSIVLVVPAERIAEVRDQCHSLKKINIIEGGNSRQESVWNGIKFLSASTPDFVMVHDAARPFASGDLITQVLKDIQEFGAALAAVPVSDTIKRVRDQLVIETIPRKNLYAAQTPQGGRFTDLYRAYESARNEGYEGTDEAELLERIGILARITEGHPENFKITFPSDLERARSFMANPFQNGD